MTTTYIISLYPNAVWNAEAGTTELGSPGEAVATIQADHPTAAREAAEPIVVETRTETTRQRLWLGRRVTMATLTTYRPCQDAVMAWQTARGLMAMVRDSTGS